MLAGDKHIFLSHYIDETAEKKTNQQFIFIPFYGFVPINKDGEIEEIAKYYGNLKYSFSSNYGFLPKTTNDEAKIQLHKLDQVFGFYSSGKIKRVEDKGVQFEGKRRKREAQDNTSNLYPPVPYLSQPLFIQHNPKKVHFVPIYPQYPTEKEDVPERVETD